MAVENTEQRVGGAPEQMPSIRDLDGGGCTPTHAVGISAGPVASNDLDARMPMQPAGQGRGIAVGQEVNDATALEIDQDRAVALAGAPSPVVDAEHARSQDRIIRDLAPDEAQEGIGRNRNAEALRHA